MPSSDATTGKFRLFVALEIPEEVKADIKRAQDELTRKFESRGIRWANPNQFHLTIKFLGTVENSHVAPLISLLRTVCLKFGPLQLKAERAGFFPNPHKPRVVWVGLTENTGNLLRLQSEIESVTTGFTEEQREEKFTAHVTIARIKAIRSSEAAVLRGLIERISDRVFGTWTASHIQLVRSELGGNGARHTVLADLPFKSP